MPYQSTLFLPARLVTMTQDRENLDVTNEKRDADVQADAELDLRGVICPYNFVKTKLKLDTMDAGQVLAVILDDGDPIRNVPRSVSDDGHTVLRQESLDRAYRVVIRKRCE
jgi:tRNA 2-thiouridine synthesizing protein A